MRTLLIIFAIVLVIGLSAYAYGKKVISKFDFGIPNFVGADLGAIFQGTGFTTVDFSSTITNNNNFSIPVSGLYVEVYYQGDVVGKSTTPHDNFTIPKNGSITITQNITLAIANSFDIGAQIIGGNKVNFTYMVKGILFNFVPFRYNGSFTY